MVIFFLQNFEPKLYPKNGSIWFFKTNSETNLLLNENFILQEAPYTDQQSSRMVKSAKTCIKENILLDSQEM